MNKLGLLIGILLGVLIAWYCDVHGIDLMALLTEEVETVFSIPVRIVP